MAVEHAEISARHAQLGPGVSLASGVGTFLPGGRPVPQRHSMRSDRGRARVAAGGVTKEAVRDALEQVLSDPLIRFDRLAYRPGDDGDA